MKKRNLSPKRVQLLKLYDFNKSKCSNNNRNTTNTHPDELIAPSQVLQSKSFGRKENISNESLTPISVNGNCKNFISLEKRIKSAASTETHQSIVRPISQKQFNWSSLNSDMFFAENNMATSMDNIEQVVLNPLPENQSTHDEELVPINSSRTNNGNFAVIHMQQLTDTFNNWEQTISENFTYSAYVDFARSPSEYYGITNDMLAFIKSCRGIDNLYDWQDECLKLNAIDRRQNLIYCLPTSGGKTLVSELLIVKEIMFYKSNVLFILPYVAIVQEKISSMSPIALKMGFLLEEYAAGKGVLPPRKRRTKHSVFIATIEKGLALINSLIETNRTNELGLVVIDEFQLVGEQDRGANLEELIIKLKYSFRCQIIAMSATIGNLNELANFLEATTYSNNFRPVTLTEYVQCDKKLFTVEQDTLIENPQQDRIENTEDQDNLSKLVSDMLPNGPCLIFCSTKKNCENVALLLKRTLPKHLLRVNIEQKKDLIERLNTSGSDCAILKSCIPFGVAYHHSGLMTEERRLIEEFYRSDVINVICCTSTLAAGVNLPVSRVIIRSPYIGKEFLTVNKYRQMIGRAGRAGFQKNGDSILICHANDFQRVKDMIFAPLGNIQSQFYQNNMKGLKNLIISSIALNITRSLNDIFHLTSSSLAAIQEISEHSQDNSKVYKNRTNDAIACIIQENIITVQLTDYTISSLGLAAVKAGFDTQIAKLVYDDLKNAQNGLILKNPIHLLYLITPFDMISQLNLSLNDLASTFSTFMQSSPEIAKLFGVNETCIMAIYTNNRPKVKEEILRRLYLALILYEIWLKKPINIIETKFNVRRGLIQQLITSTQSFIFNVIRFCEQLQEFWLFVSIFQAVEQRIKQWQKKELEVLMELPCVKLYRAKELYNAGYKDIKSIANANVQELTQKISYLSSKTANEIISTAKLMIMEKIYDLKENITNIN